MDYNVLSAVDASLPHHRATLRTAPWSPTSLRRASRRKPIEKYPSRTTGRSITRVTAWTTCSVADTVQLRVLPPWTVRYVGEQPFYKWLAVVRWAIRWLASIRSWSGLPIFAANAAKIWLDTPGRL
jgi:hypothetical protein